MKILAWNVFGMVCMFAAELTPGRGVFPAPLKALIFGLGAMCVLSEAYQLNQSRKRLQAIVSAQIQVQKHRLARYQ